MVVRVVVCAQYVLQSPVQGLKAAHLHMKERGFLPIGLKSNSASAVVVCLVHVSNDDYDQECIPVLSLFHVSYIWRLWVLFMTKSKIEHSVLENCIKEAESDGEALY